MLIIERRNTSTIKITKNKWSKFALSSKAFWLANYVNYEPSKPCPLDPSFSPSSGVISHYSLKERVINIYHRANSNRGMAVYKWKVALFISTLYKALTLQIYTIADYQLWRVFKYGRGEFSKIVSPHGQLDTL